MYTDREREIEFDRFEILILGVSQVLNTYVTLRNKQCLEASQQQHRHGNETKSRHKHYNLTIYK